MEPQDLVTLDRKEILDPETVTHIFPDLDSLERQKLYVQKALELSRGIHEDMDVFENTIYVLNDLNPTIDVMEGSLPEHIWKAVLIITSIRPDLEFSHEVKMYIKMMFSSNGYLFFPENILNFVVVLFPLVFILSLSFFGFGLGVVYYNN